MQYKGAMHMYFPLQKTGPYTGIMQWIHSQIGSKPIELPIERKYSRNAKLNITSWWKVTLWTNPWKQYPAFWSKYYQLTIEDKNEYGKQNKTTLRENCKTKSRLISHCKSPISMASAFLFFRRLYENIGNNSFLAASRES